MALGENPASNSSQYFSLTPEQRGRLSELRSAGRREEARELRQQLRDESRRARLSERAKSESIEANLRESNNRIASEKKSEIRASDNENTKNLTKIQSETVAGATTKQTFGEAQKPQTSTDAESKSFTLQSVLLEVCHEGRPALFQFYGGLVRYL